ncbi:helix-turn-helix transcriptional regulator [Ornithinimicrobium avium]|uniref:Transcriptional regulator n=1 Tax=Ornithinimicrobium avium TaxID=2283195 RepID=A0A345NP86_9MICO|nr:helix-turn-helix domain-containing protein [Ornithinimicrobium avium]AXH96844.1 transcriptional regulator [Ornithinimicrobium avium]
MDLGSHAARIGALAESTRRRLYEYVVSQPGAVGREQAARELDLAPHTVNFHLDRLAEEGLLDVEFRRLTERTGPGSGRPAKLYRRTDREVSVSLPPRRYDLVGDVLAAAVTRAMSGDPLATSVVEAAHEAGRAAGSTARPEGGAAEATLEDLARALTGLGYEPRDEDGAMVLANCPYHALAQEHTELVCGLNQHFVQGVADGVGCGGACACLEPQEGRCCVVVRSERQR